MNKEFQAIQKANHDAFQKAIDKPPPKKMGRPSSYSPEVANEIINELSTGKSMKRVCSMDGMPDSKTVWAWMAKNDDFLRRYERARASGGHAFAEIALEASEGPHKDQVEVASARLRVDTVKWFAARMMPNRYGDKLEVTGNIKVSEVKRTIIDARDDDVVIEPEQLQDESS